MKWGAPSPGVGEPTVGVGLQAELDAAIGLSGHFGGTRPPADPNAPWEPDAGVALSGGAEAGGATSFYGELGYEHGPFNVYEVLQMVAESWGDFEQAFSNLLHEAIEWILYDVSPILGY